jgi:NAD(P) transhydrogenase
MADFELIVIGAGPAGEKAAVKAAYFGHKVAIVEKESQFGGAEVITGTLPSKTLRETSLYFSGKYEKGVFGIDRDLKRQASVEDFMYRKGVVTQSAGKEVLDNIERHGITVLRGTATFEDPHTVRVGGKTYTADSIIIATGSYPAHPQDIPFDGKRVFDSDTILNITRIPKSLCVVGAGVIGCEYATIFSTMGCKVILVNHSDKILSHVDAEVKDALVQGMKEGGVDIRFNATIESLTVPSDERAPVRACIKESECVEVEMFLFAAGRNGNTKALGCEKIGLKVGKRETLEVDGNYRTNIPHIYAVGDVIGFPALASTSIDQGRVAVAHIFKTEDLHNLSKLLPLAIYTIPEVSQVGLTEEEAAKLASPYFTAKARYSDMDRGRIMGVQAGFLKLVVDRSTLSIIGVHIIGPIASELIHYGISLVEDKRTLYDIIRHVFNYPTLHELYKYAAYDGLSTLTNRRIKG